MPPFEDEGQILVCTRCSQELDSTDAFCRSCGASVGESLPILRSRASILLLLFLGIGPLALPMLWRSTEFTSTEKLWISVLNFAYLVMLAWIIFWVYGSVVFRLTGIESEPGF